MALLEALFALSYQNLSEAEVVARGLRPGPGQSASTVGETTALVRSPGHQSQPHCLTCVILGKSLSTSPSELQRGSGMTIYGCPGFS